MPGNLHFDDFWMVKEEAFELFYAGEEFYKVMFEVGAFAMQDKDVFLFHSSILSSDRQH